MLSGPDPGVLPVEPQRRLQADLLAGLGDLQNTARRTDITGGGDLQYVTEVEGGPDGDGLAGQGGPHLFTAVQ